MKGRKHKATANRKLSGKSSCKITCQRTDDNVDMADDVRLGQETIHLTNEKNFFAELVWELVMKKLKTANDIENCSNSGQFFDKLLRKKRETEVVLPNVFEILIEKFATSKDKSYEDNSYQEKYPRRGTSYLITRSGFQMTGLWKCRLVQKSWNNAIEDIHQKTDIGVFYSDYIKYTNPRIPNYHLVEYGQYNLMAKSDVFLKIFRTTHYDSVSKIVKKNPFLGRRVEFQIFPYLPDGDSDKVQKERNDIYEILEKWGREIWYCKMDNYRLGKEHDVIKFYRLLCRLLKLLPNLRVLYILYDVKEQQIALSDNSSLESEIRENPLPILLNIRSIRQGNLPRPIILHLNCVNNIVVM